jgi:hypothetical protein
MLIIISLTRINVFQLIKIILFLYKERFEFEISSLLILFEKNSKVVFSSKGMYDEKKFFIFSQILSYVKKIKI